MVRFVGTPNPNTSPQGGGGFVCLHQAPIVEGFAPHSDYKVRLSLVGRGKGWGTTRAYSTPGVALPQPGKAAFHP